MFVCIHKYKCMYPKNKILKQVFVYTNIITHINVCLHKYK